MRLQSFQAPRLRRLGWEILSLLSLAIGVFTLCALWSFHGSDPSFLVAAREGTKALNACGWVGAYLAAGLLSGVGAAGFAVPAAFLFLATTIYQGEGAGRVSGIIAGMTISVLALAVFIAIQWQGFLFGGAEIATGGAFGAWAGAALVGPLNQVGASIATLAVFAIALVASTPVSLAKWCAETLKTLSLLSWRVFKFLAASAAALIGVAILRGVQALTQGLQSGVSHAMDTLVTRARAKLAERRAAVDQAAAELTAAGSKGVLVAPAGAAEFAEHDEDFVPPQPTIYKPIQLHLESAMKAEGANAGAIFDDPEKTIEISPLDLAAAGVSNATVRATSAAGTSANSAESNSGSGATSEKSQRSSRRAVKRGAWKIPSLDFLKLVPKIHNPVNEDRLKENSAILSQKLSDFGIEGHVVGVHPGPVITLYELKPGPNTRVKEIANIEDDLKMALAAESVRVLAPIPGRSVVGIEVPSENREKISIRELIQQREFNDKRLTLPIPMGKDIAGNPFYADLARMPHLLIAGQTGSGKSVFMNTLICSLFYRYTPDELRMILIDPKVIEFRSYQDVPHLLLPVVDEMHHASNALKWAVKEMERRYRILAKTASRNLDGYNQKVDELGAGAMRDLLVGDEADGASSDSAREWLASFENDQNGEPKIGKLPYIVIIIDELADLMMIARKDVEVSIMRIAQKARAAGIHLVLATQRPSREIITGVIKANLPSRVSFRLATATDSMTVLGGGGAEYLLGQGDMLFIPPGTSTPVRMHAAYMDDEEIEQITTFLKSQGAPSYREEIIVDEDEADSHDGEDFEDSAWEQALEIARRSGTVSASSLQRQMRIGYPRAARLIEVMESRGIVGPADGARPREVLIR